MRNDHRFRYRADQVYLLTGGKLTRNVNKGSWDVRAGDREGQYLTGRPDPSRRALLPLAAPTRSNVMARRHAKDKTAPLQTTRR